MSDFSQDSIINAVNNGIRRGIQVAIDNRCLSSAIILIYSGMDSMAYLGMPPTQEDVTKSDFTNWADRYIKFPCKEQLSGAELYGARCGMLHNFSSYSRMSRKGECRVIGYMDKSKPEIRYNPAVSKELVLVSIPALAIAFFKGSGSSAWRYPALGVTAPDKPLVGNIFSCTEWNGQTDERR